MKPRQNHVEFGALIDDDDDDSSDEDDVEFVKSLMNIKNVKQLLLILLIWLIPEVIAPLTILFCIPSDKQRH